MHQRYLSCVQACSACTIACENCAASCLKEANLSDMLDCIRLDRDCADMCRLSTSLMARDSALVDEICRLCAIACQACAEECGKHAHDHCRQCAETCQRCVVECEAVSRAA
ncbi:four-helix bundle copper-binding protein [Pseudomonas sp. LS44]|uniref:four-helix bundle copper-binding protein n=1 Tax=Pseudomonas sp. LS44 TaxID=1357074 RepID=UPI00215A6BF3|nr:four-helix bundle copper-binding protein [Pseudomonas sp. LS44]UVE16530.1 four-helix bundle copper-binding protein [Pseudomonas sp. LS44]